MRPVRGRFRQVRWNVVCWHWRSFDEVGETYAAVVTPGETVDIREPEFDNSASNRHSKRLQLMVVVHNANLPAHSAAA